MRNPTFWFWGLVTTVIATVITSAAADAQQTPTHATLERIVVSQNGRSFVGQDSHSTVMLWGANYDHDRDGRLIEDYWHDEWETVEQDFAEMAELGMNVVRVHLQLGQFLESPERPNQRNLDRLRDLIRLADRTRLYLNLTGLGCYHKHDVPDWYETLSEQDRWSVQARFWREIATVAQNQPAVFCYDLMNEPVIPGGKPETEWLTGELGGKHFVQRITLDAAGRSREAIAAAWIDRLAEAIREVDRTTLITVGVIPWAQVFPGAKPLFYSEQASRQLDFVSVHFYPKSGKHDETIKSLKVYDIGKPLVIEEIFPLGASLDETMAFIDASSPPASGWISFYWGKTPSEYDTDDDNMASAVTAAWLRRFRDRSPGREGIAPAEQQQEIRPTDRSAE